MKVYRPRPEWNKWGPHLPLWFKMQLKRIDPNLVVQFRPPLCAACPEGVPADMYPYGVWDICRKLPITGYLCPTVVWSLADMDGNFSPPTGDTITIIRAAFSDWRNNRVGRLFRMLDKSLASLKRAKALVSKECLVKTMGKHLSLLGHRQFSHRVSTYMKKVKD